MDVGRKVRSSVWEAMENTCDLTAVRGVRGCILSVFCPHCYFFENPDGCKLDPKHLFTPVYAVYSLSVVDCIVDIQDMDCLQTLEFEMNGRSFGIIYLGACLEPISPSLSYLVWG